MEHIKTGATYKDACAIAGIGQKTFERWRIRYDDFDEAIKKAESECKRICETKIMAAASKQWQAAAWWLERKHSDEFAQKTRIEWEIVNRLRDKVIKALEVLEPDDRQKVIERLGEEIRGEVS